MIVKWVNQFMLHAERPDIHLARTAQYPVIPAIGQYHFYGI